MSRPVLILRPQPAAEATAQRARALGLEPRIAPLFEIVPLAWTPPDPQGFDAILLTSANALRQSGSGLAAYRHLPAFAVGEATAAAARAAGFESVTVGPSDGAALLPLVVASGARRLLHPCGRDRRDLACPSLAITPVPVYASVASNALPPPAVDAIEAGALVLLHSPRAAATFAALCPVPRDRVELAAISEAAAQAAGPGWGGVHVAGRPADEALLELAGKLCQSESGC